MSPHFLHPFHMKAVLNKLTPYSIVWCLCIKGCLKENISDRPKLVLLFLVWKLNTHFPSSSPASSCHPSVALRTFKHTNEVTLGMQRWNCSVNTEPFKGVHLAFTKSVWNPCFSYSLHWQNISNKQKTFGAQWWKFQSEFEKIHIDFGCGHCTVVEMALFWMQPVI